jgi:hypothetical protein
MQQIKKQYFSSTGKKFYKTIIDQAGSVAVKVMDRKKPREERVCWAAALYAAIDALESSRGEPALMAAGKQLYDEIKEEELNYAH